MEDNVQSKEQLKIAVRHSGLGITSFVISLVMFIFFFILVTIAGVIEISTPGGMSEESPIAVIMGMFTILGILLCLVGCGFGIAGFCQKECKKIFSILGIIFNGIILLGLWPYSL